LTWDTVYIYDTYHTQPLALVKNIHYCNLVSASWSADGHQLVVCSSDGYVSFLSFQEGELGMIYQPPVTETVETGPAAPACEELPSVAVPKPTLPKPATVALPPCEPGSTTIEQPPAKRKKIAPTLIAAPSMAELSLNDSKQKKRVQPMLLSTTNQ
jgi:chromatin assembly factor 1 subunit B